MDRIVISVNSLSKENWVNIYQFIRSILLEDTLESKTNAFLKIIEIATISLERKISKALDVYKLDDTILMESDLESLTKDTAFSLIYKKTDDTEDFAELVPFFLLREEFKKCISLGIDIDNLDLEKQSNYTFKCSDFFILFKDIPPKHGNNSIYFINEKIKNEKEEIVPYSSNHVTRLRGKGNKRYSGKSSRRFLPLIFLNQNNYKSVFGVNRDGSEEQRFINDSFSKMQRDFEQSKYSKLLGIDNDFFNKTDDTFFGKWLESGFFYSIISELESFRIPEVRNTIRVIISNIAELVQNIIFHAGKKGMLYCVYDKKVNISNKCQQNIPGFNDYKENFRFLRVGIYDFSNTGIIDTFSTHEIIEEGSHLSLTDFFDTKSVLTANLTHPEVRYAAHLGIKTFVKTIIRHKGYFSVETNVSKSCKGNKRFLETHLDEGVLKLSSEEDILFANGTHYEIVFPINPLEVAHRPVIPLQRTSLLAEHFRHSLEVFNSGKVLRSITFPDEIIEQMASCQSKDEQKDIIINLGNSLIQNKQKTNEIVLDLFDTRLDYNVIFKILSFIQLNAENGYEKILLVNTKDDFIEHINSLLDLYNTSEDVPIWSKDNAIIIISENLHAQIVWGVKRSEFEYINSELLKIYFLNFFALKDAKNKSNALFNLKFELDKEIKEKADTFVYPWDILINNAQNQSLFEQFLTRLIKRKIISKELGFLVNHENTYIGNKIIVRNYYEADMMFQNNFFTERFAFLIANNILVAIKEHRNNDISKKKKIVIIGYKHYSELLLKAVKRALKTELVYLVVANIDNDSNDYSNYFNFDVDGNGWKIKREVLKSPESFYYATIVPIGSTLSTNDKVIAYFKYWYEQQTQKKFSRKFNYNHCVIVVRDSNEKDVSDLEIEHNWLEHGIDFVNRKIDTGYLNANKVHYTLLVAYSNDNKTKNWIKRLNNEITFPKKWWEEQYVNYTENSSINSQNLMGFPKVDISAEQHREELNRLYLLKDDIIKGHIDVLNCHHKYYIDSETFVRRKNADFSKWLLNLKSSRIGDELFNLDKLNILITPSAERESDLIITVNNNLFSGNALIVYLDVKNWRNNIIHKLSFLNDLPNEYVRYHYVDQALLTGETYHRTKSYLFSILGSRIIVNFDSIITVVNRLPYTKNIEIKNDVDQNLFTYVNLHYPSTRMEEHVCELCELQKYYEWLVSRTVLDSCKDIIDKNLNKLSLLHKCEIEKKNFKLSKRNFLRLVLTHELYYVISKTAQPDIDGIDFDSESEHVIRKLDSIFLQLSNENNLEEDSDSKDQYSIDDIINSWLINDLFENDKDLRNYYIRRLETDKKISFLKVISSPPLSRYIIIRKYAHDKLLKELYKIINEKEAYQFDDLKIIKSILKSLSFIKSNALVRKDVIIGIWKVLYQVLQNLDDEINRINIFINTTIPNQINKLNADFNRNSITIDVFKSKVKLAKLFLEELRHDQKSLHKNLIIKDFSRDVQFFIKNTIVEDEAKATYIGELLRRGKEMTDFNTIRISETNLSLIKNRSDNTIFNAFLGKGYFEREYVNFLVWLFYDNTTIIRKTLENFSKEIDKDNNINTFFYGKKGDELILNDISIIDKIIDIVIKTFTQKVNSEYYYSSFKPYLVNADKIDYIQKLIYVTYAKLLLEEINNKHKKEIETDTRTLLEVFAKIMGADAAFWTMRKDYDDPKIVNCYVISKYGLDNKIEQGLLKDEYYTKKLYTLDKTIRCPLIPRYTLPQDSSEKQILKMSSLGIFSISINDDSCRDKTSDFFEYKRKEIVASITFLYNDNNSYNVSEKRFRILFQESGRLLLLLKNEIDKYIIEYLIKEKAFELWMRNYWSVTRFEKIYANSAHVFNSVYKEMEEFENINSSEISKISDTWFFLTNETINYFYSDIEKNVNNSMHFLDLNKDFVENVQNTLGMTFNDSFISILKALLDKRWRDYTKKDEDNNILMNQIFINGCDINEFKIGKDIGDNKVFCNKHILRTFVTQCLHNSLSPRSRHGHRGVTEIKRINITINSESIIIEDTCLKNFYTNDGKTNRIEQFKKKKLLIQGMRCDEYSSTTLTSLQGFVNYMCKLNHKYSCDFGFNENKNFRLTINYNKK